MHSPTTKRQRSLLSWIRIALRSRIFTINFETEFSCRNIFRFCDENDRKLSSGKCSQEEFKETTHDAQQCNYKHNFSAHAMCGLHALRKLSLWTDYARENRWKEFLKNILNDIFCWHGFDSIFSIASRSNCKENAPCTASYCCTIDVYSGLPATNRLSVVVDYAVVPSSHTPLR